MVFQDPKTDFVDIPTPPMDRSSIDRNSPVFYWPYDVENQAKNDTEWELIYLQIVTIFIATSSTL